NTPTDTPTGTPTPTQGSGETHRCNLAVASSCTGNHTPYPCCTGAGAGSCSNVHLKSALSPTINISGHQDWQFGAADSNGVRQIVVPGSGTHFDCVSLASLATVCVRPNGNGTGVIDCNGTAGTPNYDDTVTQDHNSNNGNDPGGFDNDVDCSASFT